MYIYKIIYIILYILCIYIYIPNLYKYGEAPLFILSIYQFIYVRIKGPTFSWE